MDYYSYLKSGINYFPLLEGFKQIRSANHKLTGKSFNLKGFSKPGCRLLEILKFSEKFEDVAVIAIFPPTLSEKSKI